jgi:hypothetical protein
MFIFELFINLKVEGAVVICRIFKVALVLCLFSCQSYLAADELNQNFSPRFDLLIRPESLLRPNFEVKGSVQIPWQVDRVKVHQIPWQKFSFSVDKALQKANDDGMIFRAGSISEKDSWKIDFEGLATLPSPKGGASGDEVYCLNNCPPNPELMVDKGSFYKVKFDLPTGFSALTFDSDLPSGLGLQFHIAKFQSPVFRKTASYSFEYVFPEGFSADEEYMKFLEGTMEKWTEFFGNPGLSHVKVGAIRRGEAKGEINGSPCGNLILFSRSAFGGKVDLKGLAGLGITPEDSQWFRKLVIAHELSHFWFGVKYSGRDGWMVEGIPQYLGLYAVFCENPAGVKPLLKFTEYLDKTIPQDAIPETPFGESQVAYIKAYYQGSLALFRIGEQIGHEKLLKFLDSVFKGNQTPQFADFDGKFKELFPEKYPEWLSAWRIKK